MYKDSYTLIIMLYLLDKEYFSILDEKDNFAIYKYAIVHSIKIKQVNKEFLDKI